MGKDTPAAGYYSDQDIEKFKAKLEEETEVLKSWFEQGSFKCPSQMTGIELEAWLVDKNMLPDPCGGEFIEALKLRQIVPEISKFNFEINSEPHKFSGKAFSDLHSELKALWLQCSEWTNRKGGFPMLMGTLATLRENMLSLENMSPQSRYFAMNEQVIKMRGGRLPKIHLQGKDEINLEFGSVLVECAATSLQIHLSVDEKNAARYYNASVLASPLMLAISANSPYLFGKELWDESRIAVFEQTVAMDCYQGKRGNIVQRVTLGDDYVENSLFELFAENLNHYPVLLPEISDDPPQKLGHLKLHNGTIWRWNRPIIGENPDGSPHLRIEHRAPSAGPTIADSVANTAFYLGLVDYLAKMESPPESLLSFEDAHENFYKASKQSYHCSVKWLDGKMWSMRELLLKEIFPQVKNALVQRGVDKDDILLYMDNIIYPRLKKGMNGATWQKAYVQTHGKEFQKMVETYLINQNKDTPIHLWSL